MTKKIALLLAAVLAVSSLTGCAQEQPQEAAPAVAAPQTVSVMEQAAADGKELTIDVQVEVPDLSRMEEITMCFDDALLNKMVEELVHTQYPGLGEHILDGDRKWSVVADDGCLLFSLGVTDSGFDAGRTYYLDVRRDLNGQDVGEDEHMSRTPYYLTEHIPDKLNMTAEEAGDELAAFLEQYSCFRYEPWNVVAVNCREEPDSSGYYQAKMRPYYDGCPVMIDGVPYISACLSAEGIFTFQGMMLLKEQSRKPAAVTMTLEDAVEQFKADFADDPKGDQVTVNRISVGYVAEAHYDETWVLTPAWIMEYSAVEPHLNTGEDTTRYYTNVYRMDNGELLCF